MDDMIIFYLSAVLDDGVITSRVEGAPARAIGEVSARPRIHSFSIKLHGRGIINVKVIKGHDPKA